MKTVEEKAEKFAVAEQYACDIAMIKVGQDEIKSAFIAGHAESTRWIPFDEEEPPMDGSWLNEKE